LALTLSAGLDAASRPSWYIPPGEMPTPGPTVQATASTDATTGTGSESSAVP
jgi:hypothetical protein